MATKILIPRGPSPFKVAAYDVKLTIDLETFCDSFKRFKTVPFQAYGDLPKERPLVFKSTEFYEDKKAFEQRWLLNEDGRFMKCGWKSGQATFSRCDTKEYPSILTKSLIKDFLMGYAIRSRLDLCIDRDVLHEYLMRFKVLPYDDPSPLPKERPLIFQNTTIKHACKKSLKGDCDCINEKLYLWVLSAENVLSLAIWGRREDRHLLFYEASTFTYVPRMLRTMKTLDIFLRGPCSKEKKLYWSGSFEGFCNYFNGHKMFDFDNPGCLPKVRPIVFVKKCQPFQFWFLREDGFIVMCKWMKSCAILDFSPKNCSPLRR